MDTTVDLPPESDTLGHPVSQAEAWEAAQRCIALLKERFGATRVIPFGSVVGQAPWHAGSDLDLAVEGVQPAEFFKAYSAVRKLMPRDLDIDLVPLEDAYPEIRARILGEVEMPDDPVLRLKDLVADEIKTLERIASQMGEVVGQSASPPTWVEMSAMAKLVHDFYSSTEGIFKRIAVQFDGGLPQSAHWHVDLLNRMNDAREGVRPAVISNYLWALLEEYLDFRHFFRNAYGAELEWVKLRPHVEQMPATLAMLKSQLDQFFATVAPKSQSENG
jgi:predicted nucleotidyltransferase